MNRGWVKLHRVLLDDHLFVEASPEQLKIMVACLLLANHAPKNWIFNGQRYELRPGQFITSLKSLTNKAGKGLTIQKTRTALKNLETSGFLTSKSTNKNRLITLTRWALYQSEGDELTSKLTSNQQATNKQLTTNKNVKKVINKEVVEEAAKIREVSHLDIYNEIIDYFKANEGFLTTMLQIACLQVSKKDLVKILSNYSAWYCANLNPRDATRKKIARLQKWLIEEKKRGTFAQNKNSHDIYKPNQK